MAWHKRSKGIVLVERPAGWTPASELDMPRRATVIEVVAQPIYDPITYVRQYNALSLDEAGTTWAGVICLPPVLGAEAALERLTSVRLSARGLRR